MTVILGILFHSPTMAETFSVGARDADGMNGLNAGNVSVYRMDDSEYLIGSRSGITLMKRQLMIIQDIQCPCLQMAAR